ncbi:MAG: DUF418 domain-containing protein [Bacteroidales bacterium]|nr:DUF418 domain-containing protein [Bacteroidales bacterium]
MQPIASSERIQIIDILRGFALFGVLVMNIYFFNYPNEGNLVQEEYLSSGDSITSWVLRVLISGKFYILFSFLFGLGFSIQITRLKNKDINVVQTYTRRLFILLGFGLIHSILIWNGDILKLYAIIGFILLLFRNSSLKRVKIWIIILFSLFYIGYAVGAILDSRPKKDKDKVENTLNEDTKNTNVDEASDENKDEEILVEKDKNEISFEEYKNGNYFSTIKENINVFIEWKQLAILVLGLLFILPLFLLGSYFGRKEIFSNKNNNPFLLKLMLWSLLIGTIMSTMFIYFGITTSKGDETFQRALMHIGEQYAALPLTLAYISAVTLLYNKNIRVNLLKPLAPVGQMALTNYLLQSIVFTWVFYGQGLGLIGQKSTVLLLLIGIVFFSIQVIVSKWWMSKFKFGPAEWLWRVLTYGEMQSFKK